MTEQDPTPTDPTDVGEQPPLPHDVVEAILHYDEGDRALDADRPPTAATNEGGDADGEPTQEQSTEEDPLTAALRERDEYLDALQRKQAEFENFRRRTREEGARLRDLGRGDVAERMLDVLDDFDRTIEAAGDVEEGFLKGVQLVHDKLLRSLGEVGLARIDDAGAPFDPNRHDAVQQVDGDEAHDEPVVHQVLRPGYELGGRVLRAAMVVVAQ